MLILALTWVALYCIGCLNEYSLYTHKNLIGSGLAADPLTRDPTGDTAAIRISPTFVCGPGIQISCSLWPRNSPDTDGDSNTWDFGWGIVFTMKK